MEFAKSFQESSSSTPMFFILSPGVDPLKDVEKLGKKMNFTMDNGNFHNVSLGQGQEEVAENAMELAAEEGHWVILQNIHLVAKYDIHNVTIRISTCSGCRNVPFSERPHLTVTIKTNLKIY